MEQDGTMVDEERPPLRIAVLISGGGTTLNNLIEKDRQGDVDLDFRRVISSSPDAGGLRYAEKSQIPVDIIETKDYESALEFSEAVFEKCREADVNYVIMAGFLKRLRIPDDFTNRVLNIHPALIPAFCGKGFYGLRVHQAALDYGVKISGCTVHFADNEYDHGPVLLQQAVPVKENDTPQKLAARVFEAECEAYPRALRLLHEDRVQVVGRRVSIRRD